ncbi:reverse transcriptase-like protein [Patescibacteria group bacterium]|nr:reverse transcriptase-like protein [Patescibacteria group bacterium]
MKEEKIVPLFIKAWNLKLGFDQITVNFIPREQNKEADKLVNMVLDSQKRVNSIPGI